MFRLATLRTITSGRTNDAAVAGDADAAFASMLDSSAIAPCAIASANLLVLPWRL